MLLHTPPVLCLSYFFGRWRGFRGDSEAGEERQRHALALGVREDCDYLAEQRPGTVRGQVEIENSGQRPGAWAPRRAASAGSVGGSGWTVSRCRE